MWKLASEELPELEFYEPLSDTPDRSRPVIIKGKDRCIWLAYWDGEVWHNANSSDKIWMNKDYVIKWMYIPEE